MEVQTNNTEPRGPRILSIDSDSASMKIVKRALKSVNPWLVFAKSLIDFESKIEFMLPDLILINLDLTNRDGNSSLDFGRMAKAYKIPHMYITSGLNESLFISAQESKPELFIRKPIMESMLNYSVSRFIRNMAEENIQHTRKVEVNTKNLLQSTFRLIRSTMGKYVLIQINDVLFFKSDSVHITVTTKFIQFQTRSTIPQLISLLGSKSFIQIHRSYGVNLIHVKELKSKSIIVDTVELPISRVRADEVLAGLRAL